MGELHARCLLLSKGIKINRQRLRTMLKNLKQSNPLNANPIRHREHRTRTSNSTWHMDATHELTHWHFVISSAVGGHSKMIMQFKCSDNNRDETACNHFNNAVQEH